MAKHHHKTLCSFLHPGPLKTLVKRIFYGFIFHDMLKTMAGTQKTNQEMHKIMASTQYLCRKGARRLLDFCACQRFCAFPGLFVVFRCFSCLPWFWDVLGMSENENPTKNLTKPQQAQKMVLLVSITVTILQQSAA